VQQLPSAKYYLTQETDPSQLAMRFFMGVGGISCVVSWHGDEKDQARAFTERGPSSARPVDAFEFAQEIAATRHLDEIAVQIDADVPMREELIERAHILRPN
jgi:hypothetical protein